MHIEFLIEDSSGAKLLETLVPKIIGDIGSPHTWRFHSYKGIGRIPRKLTKADNAAKRQLLTQLPKLLRGYAKTPGIDLIVVLVDSDTEPCSDLLADLKRVATDSGIQHVLFRIAIEEVEAWYLGDRPALTHAYPRAKPAILNTYVQDSICGTWELLADAVEAGGSARIKSKGWPRPGEVKHQWAEAIAPHLNIDANASPSFRKFVEGIRRFTS